MYIKSIKAQGFKSFADKLELDFNSKISAIVGPNGSGKSNVVDAILWVLGEQSVKNLRGDSQMSDVIFSGSASRDELKKASVAILFDNSDHALATEFNEVEIKRVIYKTGENEYYINNARVRLKDITDLLIDVTSKFNIITQGNVSALVDNKSSERRTLFESAAGVLKYRKRKEEALRKLESTKDNISRINLIIKELNVSLDPLEKQKDEAEKYLKVKKDLEQIEIAVVSDDITKYSKKCEELKSDSDIARKKLEGLTLTHPISLEKKKLEAVKMDEEIRKLNQDILNIAKEISSLDSQKQINLERAKFHLEKDVINENLLSLKEEKLSLEKDIEVNQNEITSLEQDFRELTLNRNEESDLNLKLKLKLSSLNNEVNNLNKEILVLENKINIEKQNMENNVFLPKSVRSILANPRLTGIHNTIGNVITTDNEYEIALNTALGASINFLIVENNNSAKKAIEYLKENHLGRATFFPIDVIKSRYIDKSTFENEQGFIAILSDILKYDKKYQNIIENQLGNVILVDNIDNMFRISKKCDSKYKMVTLDGQIIFPGGSVAGGDSENKNQKSSLNDLNKELNEKENCLKLINSEVTLETEKYEKNNDNLYNHDKKLSEKRILIDTKRNITQSLNEKLTKVNNDINSLDNMNNSELDNLLDKLTIDISNKTKDKEIFESNLSILQSKKFDLTNEINSIEKEISEQNSNYHALENQISANDVELGKYEVRIDTLLETLSTDYNMTYEYAKDNYPLQIDEKLAKDELFKLKNQMKHFGEINIGAISEYERLKKRFDFLDDQRNDLDQASEELLNTISEMDTIMIEKFKTTFDKIAEEFSKVFRLMFKGGNGLLKLTDETDLLNTGINIMAVPPGKKLNSTAYLSGGEKSLTALCLIFAILNVRPVPFIILDEAEAALDEENISMLGEYISSKKNDSQFIMITHKKKMMEYADVLYGVTMQESGVSKLVSVKLEN